MTDNVNHVGREVTEEALGKTWRFSRWNRRVWTGVATWARQHLPDPIAELAKSIDQVMLADGRMLRGLKQQDELDLRRYQREIEACKDDAAKGLIAPPVAVAPLFTPTADFMARLAIDKAASAIDFTSRELNVLIDGPLGRGYTLYLLLQEHHPGITEDEAFEIGMALILEPAEGYRHKMDRVISVTQGRMPPASKNGQAPAA